MKIYEYADNITLPNGKHIDYKTTNSFPFMYILDNELIIGDEKGIHMQLVFNYCKINNIPISDEMDCFDKMDESSLMGRFWLNEKVIAIWEFDKNNISDINKLKKLINKIEDKFNINVNDEWYIEFEDNQDRCFYFVKLIDLINKNDLSYGKNTTENKYSTDLIRKWHLMNSVEKEKNKKDFGYRKTPKSLKWKQALIKSESKVLNFNNFLLYLESKSNIKKDGKKNFNS